VRNNIAMASGASQLPVRQALQHLGQEGRVTSFPQSRTLVSKFVIAQAQETQFLRRGVELEVSDALACAGDPTRLAPVNRLLLMQKFAGDGRDIDEFNTLDRLFHLS
jgi:GntR family transcriptional regulator, rspAB operon transcriptional repressor